MQIHGRYLKPIIGCSLYFMSFRFPVARQEKEYLHFLILQKFLEKNMCNDNNQAELTVNYYNYF